MTVHVDISQLVMDPRRSGIQRAERELIRHWPGPAPLVPCRFDPLTRGMQELPASMMDALCADTSSGGFDEDLRQLRRHLSGGKPTRPDRLLAAELFLDPARAAFYRRTDCATYWLVFDFLPWLQPDWFSPGSAAGLMPFIQALRSVRHLAFISAQTRDDCARRIVRRPQHGPVIPMGADGLGLEPQVFRDDRQRFVMLGTIEPRKNAAPAIRAFQDLWRQGSEAELVMIGALSPDAAEEQTLILQCSGQKRFRHLRSLSDAGVRDELRHARALLFPSEGEGFGIPPMEALHAGIPVIVAEGLPALSGMSGLGQIRLPEVSPRSIADAVRSLADGGRAGTLWSEAAGLSIPGWSDFARSVAAWVQR